MSSEQTYSKASTSSEVVDFNFKDELKLDDSSKFAARAIISNDLKTLQEIYKETRVCFLDRNLHTPLHLSAQRGSLKCLKWLLKNTHIPVRLRNNKYETCAHLAAKNGHLKCLKSIVYSGPLKPLTIVCEKDENGMTVLHIAAKSKQEEIVNWLVDAFGKTLVLIKNKTGQIALHYAAAKGYHDCVVTLSKMGKTSVNAKDKSGATPCYYCAQENRLFSLQHLVNVCKCDLRISTASGYTPLMIACRAGHRQIIEFLVGKLTSADLQTQADDGCTVFHMVCVNGHADCLGILLQNGGFEAVRLLDRRGCTAAHDAAENGFVACLQMLVTAGLDMHLRNNDGQTPYTLALQSSNQLCANFAKDLTGGEVIDYDSSMDIMLPIVGQDSRDIHNIRKSEEKWNGPFGKNNKNKKKKDNKSLFSTNSQILFGEVTLVKPEAQTRGLYIQKGRPGQLTLPYISDDEISTITQRNSTDSEGELILPNVCALRQQFECLARSGHDNDNDHDRFSEKFDQISFSSTLKDDASINDDRNEYENECDKERIISKDNDDDIVQNESDYSEQTRISIIMDESDDDRNNDKKENNNSYNNINCTNNQNDYNDNTMINCNGSNDELTSIENDNDYNDEQECEYIDIDCPKIELIHEPCIYATSIPVNLIRSSSQASILPPLEQNGRPPTPPPLPNHLLTPTDTKAKIKRTAPLPPFLPAHLAAINKQINALKDNNNNVETPNASPVLPHKLANRRRSSRLDEISQSIQQTTMLAPYFDQAQRARDRRPSISIQDQVKFLNKNSETKVPIKEKIKAPLPPDMLSEVVKRAQERQQRQNNKPKIVPNYIIPSIQEEKPEYCEEDIKALSKSLRQHNKKPPKWPVPLNINQHQVNSKQPSELELFFRKREEHRSKNVDIETTHM